MKFKHKMLIALLIACLLTMTTVSATSDSNDTLASDTNGDYTTTHETNTNGVGENDNSQTILKETENTNTLSEPEGSDDGDEGEGYDADINVVEDEDISTSTSDDERIASISLNKDDNQVKKISIQKQSDDEPQNIFEKNTADFDDTRKTIDDETGRIIYNITIKDLIDYDATVFSNILNNDDGIEFILWNSTDERLTSRAFNVFLDDDTIKFIAQEDNNLGTPFPGLLDDDDDEYKGFEIGESVLVSYLYLPKDYEDVTITVTKNEELFYTNNTSDMTPEDFEDKNRYPLILNLTQLNNEDLVSFRFSCFDDDVAWTYAIEIDEENNRIIFIDDPEEEEEELHGEGTEIEDAQISDKIEVNTGGIIASIPIGSLNSVNDDFEVIIQSWDYTERTELKLSDFTATGGNYLIKLSDLSDKTKQTLSGVFYEYYKLIIQFFKDEEPSQFIEGEIVFYINPYVENDDTPSIVMNDIVITLFGLPEGASDNFTITSSKEGSDPIIKLIKKSELTNNVDQITDEETGEHFIDEYYLLTVADLGITEVGEYNITVKFQIGDTIKKYSYIFNIVQLNIYAYDNEGKPYDDISQSLFDIFLDNNTSNKLVKLFVNDELVAEKNITDMEYSIHHGCGRYNAILNYFQIVSSGDYSVKIEVYNDTDGTILLGDASNDISVIAGDNEITFKDTAYDIFNDGGYIEAKFSKPLKDGEYYLVELNGIDVIKYTPTMNILNTTFFDVYYDEGDEKELYILKPGTYIAKGYDVNGDKTQISGNTFKILEKSETVNVNHKSEILKNETLTITINTPKLKDGDLIRIFDMKSKDEYIVLDKLLELYNLRSDDPLWADGKINVNITDLQPGEHNLFIVYGGDYLWDIDPAVDNFYRKATKVTVIELDPKLEMKIDNIEEGSSLNIQIKTNNTFTGNVLVQINGSNHTVNVKNGEGTLTLSDLKAGNYLATAIFNATEIFKNSTITTPFSVTSKVKPNPETNTTQPSGDTNKNQTTTTPSKQTNTKLSDKAQEKLEQTYPAKQISITSKKTTKVSKKAKKLTLKATLKVKGKKVNKRTVKFIIKGKTYKAKTNKNGVATLKLNKKQLTKILKKVKVGKKITYKIRYGKKTVKKSLKVKK